MKILYVCTVDSMINNFLIPHIKKLEERGDSVDVLCSDTGFINELQDKHNLNIFEANFNRNPLKFKNIIGLVQAVKTIKNNNYDIIHAHEPVGGVIGRIAGKICGKKVYYTVHGFHFNENNKFILNFTYYIIEKIMSIFTDKIFVMNEYDYTYAKKMYGKKPVIKVNGVGIDTNKYNVSKMNLKEIINIKKELNFNDNDIVVGTVAEFIKRKCYEDFLNTAKELLRLNDKYKFLLIGDGEYLGYYMEYADKIGIKDSCVFTGYTNQVDRLINVIDIFLFTSLQEGLPRALMEAMANEKYIVCSDIRGNRDLIKNEVNGYLVKNGDINGYVKSISNYYKYKNIFGVKCKEDIVNKFELYKVINDTISEY